MSVEITTISVTPKNASALRAIRDAKELPNMDSALEALIEESDTNTDRASA